MTNLEFSKTFQPEFSCWVKWEEGDFRVLIKYLSLGAVQKLVKDCQSLVYDNKTHQRVEKIDDEKFKKKIADLIVDWKDLTAKKARKFVNLSKETPDDGEFPCTGEAKAFVISEFPGFPTFIFDMAKELHQREQEVQADQVKN